MENKHLEFKEYIEYLKQLQKEEKFFGTKTSPSLRVVRAEGFNPIGICNYGGEETFIFKTKKEANSAYKKIEKEQKKLFAWWYSKKQFEKEVGENSGYYKPSEIDWL
jgi:hypothetical protein